MVGATQLGNKVSSKGRTVTPLAIYTSNAIQSISTHTAASHSMPLAGKMRREASGIRLAVHAREWQITLGHPVSPTRSSLTALAKYPTKSVHLSKSFWRPGVATLKSVSTKVGVPRVARVAKAEGKEAKAVAKALAKAVAKAAESRL